MNQFSYDRDFRLWAIEQARLVAEGSWHEIDRENVALADIARAEEREARRLIRSLLKQLLLWSVRPERQMRPLAEPDTEGTI
jgi:hypothetical protein